MRKRIVVALTISFVSFLSTLLALSANAQEEGGEYVTYLPMVQVGHVVPDDTTYHQAWIPDDPDAAGAWTMGQVSRESYEAMKDAPVLHSVIEWRAGPTNATPSLYSSYQYVESRTYLAFDLSDLPAGRITDARLVLNTGMGNATNHLDFNVYFHEGTWDGYAPDVDDYDSFLSEPLMTLYAGDLPLTQAVSIPVELNSLVGRERPDMLRLAIRLDEEPLSPNTKLTPPLSVRDMVDITPAGETVYESVSYIEIALEPTDS